MIIFVTNYDDNTYCNYKIITCIKSKPNYIMKLSNEATKKNLHEAVELYEEKNLFIMSHGEDESVIDNDRIMALSLADKRLLKNRKIFVYACKTGKSLGEEISKNSNVYFGYINSIQAPYWENGLDEYFVPIFNCIVDNLTTINSLNQAKDFIDDLKKICENTSDNIANNKALKIEDEIGIHRSLRDIWRLLICWIDGSNEQSSSGQVNPINGL